MDFNPINDLPVAAMTDGVVPTMLAAMKGFQGGVDIHTAAQQPRVGTLDVCAVRSGERAETVMKAVGSEVRCRDDSVPKTHRPLAATAAATSALARSLNSDKPPQLASNVACADGSRRDMSCTFPDTLS